MVRLVLFDKYKYVGNVLTIPVEWHPESPGTWQLSHLSRLALGADSDNILLLRANISDPNICLLLELCVLLRSADGVVGEMSCGWSQLPLFHLTSGQATAKQYELRVHAGTPFESGLRHEDPSPKTKKTAPRLVIKLGDLKSGTISFIRRADLSPTLMKPLSHPNEIYYAYSHEMPL